MRQGGNRKRPPALALAITQGQRGSPADIATECALATNTTHPFDKASHL